MKKKLFLGLLTGMIICPNVIKAYDDPEIMTPTCSLFRGQYYGMKGNVVDKETYEKECNPKCRQRADKYYDNNGKEITKEAFERECKSGEPTLGQPEVIDDPSFTAATTEITFAAVVEKYKTRVKEVAELVDNLTIEEVTNNDNNNLTIKYKYTTLTTKEDKSGSMVFAFADNKFTYTLDSPESHLAELYLNRIFTNVLVEVLATEVKGADFETTSVTDQMENLTLEKNGIQVTVVSKEYSGVTNANNQPESGTVDGYSAVTIDLKKINFDEFDDSNVNNGGGTNNPAHNVTISDDEDTTSDASKKCSEGDGKYYDKNGNLVSKEAYFESCGVVENPKTGSKLTIILLPLIIIGFAIMKLTNNKSPLKRL